MKVTFDSKRVDKLIKRAIVQSPEIVSKALDRATASASNELVERTQRGQGVDGALKPYSPQYAAYRVSKGRQASSVDLNFTGRMLGSIVPFKAKVSRGSRSNKVWSSIAPARAAEKKKAFYTDKERHWFGISTMEQRVLRADFRKHFKTLFKVKIR